MPSLNMHGQTLKDIHERINSIVASNCEYPQNIDEYTLLRKIGKGTFGTVFEAKCKNTEETVAIKTVLS